MDDLRMIGRLLITAGIMLAVLGGLFMLGGRIPWLGHLPGDISIQRKNLRLYFPFGTCVLLSVILTLILWLFRRR